MAKKIKYNGTNVPERVSSGGSIPGITGSESVERNYFLNQLHAWQNSQLYRNILSDLESMFSDFPGPNNSIKASVRTRSGADGYLTFPMGVSSVKCINYVPPKSVLRRTYTGGDGTLPTDRSYMRYIIVGGGGGGGKGTSPWAGTGVGGAGGGGGGMAFGEANIGGYSYTVGEGGAGATAHGNRAIAGGTSSISKTRHTNETFAVGGAGGGNDALYGLRGSAHNILTNRLTSYEIDGGNGGRNRVSGSSRSALSATTQQTLGLGDLIDGGDGYGWINLLKTSYYFGTSAASGGAGVDVNGGGGGGGASLGRGGSYKSNKTWTTPGIGGGGGGGGQPTKGINGQRGGDGVIYIFW